VNLKTAARRLGVHYQTAYRWVRSGQLVAVKVGAGYEISDAALERFEAQRVALERLPEPSSATLTIAESEPETREHALEVLDHMVDAVTANARPIIERGGRFGADVLGDAVIVALRDDDGEIAVAHIAHHDPVSEVALAAVAYEVPFALEIARLVVRTGSPMFVPQVPQRDVRRSLRPELHEFLLGGGCYSLITVPIGTDERIDGALMAVRDGPGRPYEREDIEFVSALGARISLAHARAAHSVTAKDARRRVVDTVRAFLSEYEHMDTVSRSALDELLESVAGDDPESRVAVLDLDLRHLGCTKAYANQLGQDRTRVVTAALGTLVADPPPLYRSFDEVLVGELDFRTVDIQPVAATSPVTLHAAMIRGVDATPWCIVVVATPVPQLPSDSVAGRHARSVSFPAATTTT
jgi:excisionase family DNA binding protein